MKAIGETVQKKLLVRNCSKLTSQKQMKTDLNALLLDSLTALHVFRSYTDDFMQIVCKPNLEKWDSKVFFINASNCEDDNSTFQWHFEKPLDTIVLLKKDKEILRKFLKKYKKFDLNVIDHPQSCWHSNYAIFCCNNSFTKQFFEVYKKETKDFKQFLKSSKDIKDTRFSKHVCKYFDVYEDSSSKTFHGIFHNDFQLVLSEFSKNSKTFIKCDQIFYDKISFYEFYNFLNFFVFRRDLKDLEFICPDNKKQREFYEKFCKLVQTK